MLAVVAGLAIALIGSVGLILHDMVAEQREQLSRTETRRELVSVP